MGKFQIRQTETGYKFDLKAANGETVATSEVYTTLARCRKGIESTVRSALKANFADLSRGEKAANPKFELFLDKAGRYRFRLRARNGQVIACSDGYATREGCENGILSVRKNTQTWELEEIL